MMPVALRSVSSVGLSKAAVPVAAKSAVETALRLARFHVPPSLMEISNPPPSWLATLTFPLPMAGIPASACRISNGVESAGMTT